MPQTPRKIWWLLALCGVLEALLAFLHFFAEGPNGLPVLRQFMPMRAVLLVSFVAMAAGLCTLAAGILRFRDRRSSLLALNGMALAAYGLLPILFRTRPLSFGLFVFLLAAMAAGAGLFAWASARDWFPRLAGAASCGVALAFVGLAFHWIRLAPTGAIFLWLGSYFAVAAVCMLALALRLHRPRPA